MVVLSSAKTRILLKSWSIRTMIRLQQPRRFPFSSLASTNSSDDAVSLSLSPPQKKQSPLRRLDAIATERGCDYSWLEQCTNVGWRIQLSLSLKGKKPIIIEDTSESKLQAKNSCANIMLSYLDGPLKDSNQNVRSTIELNSSTISLITTSSTSLQHDGRKQTVLLDEILEVVRSFGRREVDTQTIQQTLLLRNKWKKIPIDLIRKILQECVKLGKIKKRALHMASGGGTFLLWQIANELERTSFDEIESIIVELNQHLLSSRKPNERWNDRKEMINKAYPEKYSSPFAIHYEIKSEVIHNSFEDIFYPKPVHKRTSSIRYSCIATLVSGEIPIVTGKSSNVSSSATSSSLFGWKLDPIQAQINACHDLLYKMSESDIFSQIYKRKCKELWEIALLRGRRLSIGEIFPFPESKYWEYKGHCENSTDFNVKQLNDTSFNQVPKIITGFINAANIDKRIPLVPGRILFGIHDGTRKLHGICLKDLFGGPEIACSKFREDQEIYLHQLLSQEIDNTVSEWVKDKLLQALKLEVHQLVEPATDCYVDHHQHHAHYAHKKSIFVLLVVELDFNKFALPSQLIAMQNGDYNIRSIQKKNGYPGTRKLTKKEVMEWNNRNIE